MIHRHLHDIMMSCHLGAIMRGQLIRRTKAESAAMQVQHHGTLAAQARRPNVQLQHVLALPSVIPVEKKGLLDAGPWMQGLRAVGAIGQSWILVCPGRGRFCGQPAVFSGRRLAVRHAFERKHSVNQESAHLAILRFCNGGTRGGAVSGFLMRSGFCAVRGKNRRCGAGGAQACRCSYKKRASPAEDRRIERFSHGCWCPYLMQFDVFGYPPRRATLGCVAGADCSWTLYRTRSRHSDSRRVRSYGGSACSARLSISRLRGGSFTCDSGSSARSVG